MHNVEVALWFQMSGIMGCDHAVGSTVNGGR